MKISRLLACVVAAAALSGCGSGGGDSSPGPQPKGQFGSAVVTDLQGTAALAFGDFDRDGKPDAVASVAGTRLVFLKGNGDGSFMATHSMPALGSVFGIAAADLNKDGLLDFAVMGCVANPCPASGPMVYVFLGNGAGAFTSPMGYGAGANASTITIADLNGDGIPDVAAGHSTGGAAVLLGNGDGTLKPPTTWATDGLSSNAIAAADFTGDGKPDLIVFASGFLASVSLLPGLGNGEFGPASVEMRGDYPSQSAVIDLNRDGRLDLVLNGPRAGSQPGPGSVAVILGKGDGTFGPTLFTQDYPNPSLGAQFAAGDIDRDGIPDLVVLGTRGELSLLYGRGDGTFMPRVDFPLSLEVTVGTPELADVNGDGRLDLVIHTAQGFAVLPNTR